MGAYLAANGVQLLLLAVRYLCVCAATQRAASALHDAALDGVLAAPLALSFAVPSARLLELLTAETARLDGPARMAAGLALAYGQLLLGSLAIVSLLSLPVLCAAALALAAYTRTAAAYRAAAAEAVRLEAAARGPLYAALLGHMAGAGVQTLRAARAGRAARARVAAAADEHSRTVRALIGLEGWQAVRVAAVGHLLVFFAAAQAAVSHARLVSAAHPHSALGLGLGLGGGRGAAAEAAGLEGGGGGGDAGERARLGAAVAGAAALSGLCVVYATLVSQQVGALVAAVSQMELALGSVEALACLAALPAEGAGTAGTAGTADAGAGAGGQLQLAGPASDEVRFVRASLCYRPGVAPALDRISITLRPGEKLGVAGRTGAGKSSLAVALLRLVELSEGRVELGGVDVRHLPLRLLRSRVALVSQTPLVLAGSVRLNLDPEARAPDAALVRALERARLGAWAQAHGGLRASLDLALQGSGGGGGGVGSLSAGEAQQLCVARALVRGARVLLMDEATASIDAGTEAALGVALASELEGVSVLLIAHRVRTLLACDRVIVLAHGRLLEEGTPAELSARAGSRVGELLALAARETGVVLK